MKWSVALLLVVGVLAAGASAVLLAALGTRAPAGTAMEAASPDVQIIVASRSLEPYTVVTADCVATRKVSQTAAPEGYLGDPAHAIGKALRLSLAKGQLFTRGCFATDDSPQSVASRTASPRKTRQDDRAFG